jgi:two-component system, NarL family, invasion response regulator UvrY
VSSPLGTRTDSAASTVNVLIVDDQPPFRDVARTVVSLLTGWKGVAEAATGEDAVLAARATEPGIVLMDINLPGISGIEATRQIVAAAPGTRVILLSTYQADDLPADALSCGAAAYVRKEDLTPRVLRDVLVS